MSRHQGAVLGLSRVGVEAGRAHPVPGRVTWRGGGVRVRRLRVPWEGGRRAGGWREGGFRNVGGAQELSHAGFVGRVESRRVVGACWRTRRCVNAVPSRGRSHDLSMDSQLVWKWAGSCAGWGSW